MIHISAENLSIGRCNATFSRMGVGSFSSSKELASLHIDVIHLFIPYLCIHQLTIQNYQIDLHCCSTFFFSDNVLSYMREFFNFADENKIGNSKNEILDRDARTKDFDDDVDAAAADDNDGDEDEREEEEEFDEPALNVKIPSKIIHQQRYRRRRGSTGAMEAIGPQTDFDVEEELQFSFYIVISF